MSSAVSLLISVSLLMGQAQADRAKQTPDLDLIPSDAAVFFHIRVADLWNSDGSIFYRQLISKAGVEALADFEKRFSPAPSNLERISGYMRDFESPKAEGVLIVSVRDALDPKTIFARTFPGAREEKIEGKSYFVRPDTLAIAFHDERTLLVGPVECIRAVYTKRKLPTGPLAASIAAAPNQTIVVAISPKAMQAKTWQEVPPPWLPLTKAELFLWTYDLKAPNLVDARLYFADAQSAAQADEAIRSVLKLGRFLLANERSKVKQKLKDHSSLDAQDIAESATSLLLLGAINTADELLVNPPLKRIDNSLVLSTNLPPEWGASSVLLPVLSALLLPAVQKVREAAARTQTINHMKQLAVAMHNYHGTQRGLPSAAICNPQGRPLLSWRVALLPFLDEQELYEQFKLNEPWDSEHNKKLIPLMPKFYEVPSSATVKPGETHFKLFVGGSALFELKQKTRFTQVSNDLSNTLMIAPMADTVPWTKPEDVTYDAKMPVPPFLQFADRKTYVTFADGSVRQVPIDLDDAAWRMHISRTANIKK